MTDSIKRAGWWRRALAGGVDFWILFVVLVYAIACLTEIFPMTAASISAVGRQPRRLH